MDEDVNRFLRDGVFEKNSHKNFFTAGKTLAQRQQWLREVDQICKETGIAYVVRETRNEKGNHGYEFGFADAKAYAAFILSVFDDLEAPRGHIYSHGFDNASHEYRRAFLLAAEAHLSALGINHYWREHEGQLEFAFDRFSDKLMLQALIDNETIDVSAKGIAKVRELQRRLGRDPDAPGGGAPAPEPGP
jgi:quinol monooxygenase YgiN